MEKNAKVCVTGGAGYIGSWLVKKLLDKGHTVHATLRNPDDHSKTQLLKGLPNADSRLKLFRADIYDADEYEQAIRGCEYVFHLANPMQHDPHSTKYKDAPEAAVAGLKNIVGYCLRSGTVKRLIYTASVTAASPLNEDGTGFKDSIDESCWTPLHLSFSYCSNLELDYTCSKTLSEKEALNYCNRENAELEVVSLACGLVGGDTILPYFPLSMAIIISQITSNVPCHRQLRFLQALLGSVPIIHIDDVCDAHVFCMEQPSMSGRFLCASAYPTIPEIGKCYKEICKDLAIEKEFMEGPKRGIGSGSKKLVDMGFEYKHDLKKILEDNLECAKKMGFMK